MLSVGGKVECEGGRLDELWNDMFLETDDEVVTGEDERTANVCSGGSFETAAVGVDGSIEPCVDNGSNTVIVD